MSAKTPKFWETWNQLKQSFNYWELIIYLMRITYVIKDDFSSTFGLSFEITVDS